MSLNDKESQPPIALHAMGGCVYFVDTMIFVLSVQQLPLALNFHLGQPIAVVGEQVAGAPVQIILAGVIDCNQVTKSLELTEQGRQLTLYRCIGLVLVGQPDLHKLLLLVYVYFHITTPPRIPPVPDGGIPELSQHSGPSGGADPLQRTSGNTASSSFRNQFR